MGGIATCKFIEVIPNVKGLVIVPSVFVVNEFDISCGRANKRELVDKSARALSSKPFFFFLL